MSISSFFLCRVVALPVAVLLLVGEAPAQETATGTTPAVEDARAAEFAVWNGIKASHNPADFVAYLERYPKGNFAKAARNRLTILTGSTPAVSETQQTSIPSDDGAAAAVDVPQDPAAAEGLCRDENVSPDIHLAACDVALRATGLDAATRAYLTNELGRAHHDLEHYDEAASAYREAMRYDAANANYPSNLGLVLEDAGHYAEAAEAFGKAIELDPQNAWHFYNRGNAYLYAGDPAKAVPDLDAALAIQQSFELLATRGYVASAVGDDKAAQEFTSRAIAYDGSDYNLQSIAVLYLGGRDREATDMSERLIAASSGFGYGQIWKAMLLTRDGKSGAARTLLSNTLTEHGEDWLGKLMQWMLGKIDDAALLAAAGNGTPEEANNQLCEAHFYMGAVAFDRGDKTAAAAHFKAVLETKVHHYIEYYAAAGLLRQAESGN